MKAFGFAKHFRPDRAAPREQAAPAEVHTDDDEAQIAALESAVTRLIDQLNEEARSIATLAPDAIASRIEAKQATLGEIERLTAGTGLLERLTAGEPAGEDEDEEGAAVRERLRLRLLQLSEAVAYNKDMLATAKQAVEKVTASIRDALAAAQTDFGYSPKGTTTNSVTGEFASVDRAL
jgi:hypothetical protein